MASSRRILGAGGAGFGAGLLLLIGGLVVKHAQAHMLAECSTGLGQFGQVIDPNAANKCSTAQALSSMATAAIWIGAIVLAIAVGGLVAFLIASGAVNVGKKHKTVVPGTTGPRPAGPGPVAPVRPQSGGSAVLRPIVPVVVGQEDSAPAYPTALGCGHEPKNGTRFCTVCGRPAASDTRRDVFAAEPGITASGAEITAVLPVFAPAEPVGLTAPAMVPDLPSERSLASVATGPQVGLADRPPAPAVPAGPAGFADRPAVPAGPAAQAGFADRPPVPAAQAGPAVRPLIPGPVARSADRPPAPRSGVSASPPWGWADPPPAPGSAVSSAPPWGQTEHPPAAPEASLSSGPPWGWAEHLPASSGAKPDEDGAGSRQTGRHRSRRP